ncbi:MAG: heavy metal translocating P-type ATPase [Mogibacterium sp.]|nr:heavy metal translocating P-type ATPase [Mogibacterium sp.]
MERYTVSGMSCAACQARVKKAVSKVEGVESCSVSLLTNSMTVEGSASAGDVIRAVTDAGYGAVLKSDGSAQEKPGSGIASAEDALEDRETPVLKRRLLWSLGFLLVLMYFSMGHMMWGWPVPSFFEDNHVAMGLLQMILAAIVMIINQKFFISGSRGLLHGAPNMDTLVAMGSAASFCWSVYVLFAMTGAQSAGSSEAVTAYMHDLYFESAAMILTLITVGKMLEARSKGKTTDALKSLMKLAPQTAVVERGGVETEIPVSQLAAGDIFLVRPGENIPVDGVIIEGDSAVNEAALTGESVPVDKGPGDSVSAATANQSGFIRCRATRVGEDTTFAQIIRMVSDAAATKAPIARIADKVSGVFVPVVMGIALVTLIVWLLAGKDAGFALARAISVLVISCPCALGLATPVAIMVGSGVGARNGILFKTAAALEETGRVETVALDKTGTITGGDPVVTDVFTCRGVSKDELLTVAAAVESRSTHPLAKAVSEYIGGTTLRISDYAEVPGGGVKAFTWDGSRAVGIAGGNAGFMTENGVREADVERLLRETAEFANAGKTSVLFEKGGRLLGLIALADSVRDDSVDAIKQFREMGIKTVMLTGDRKKTAEAIAAETGVDEVMAEVLPDGKEEAVRSLMEQSRTAMVGDGINDAPALTRANVGIAIGAGTDVAIDAADVVLVNSRLADAVKAVRLGRSTLRNIHQNLFWAFFYNAICIPVAAGVYYPVFGWTLNPMLAAAAMSLSSFCVVTNALRLNLFDAGERRSAGPAEEKSQEQADAAYAAKAPEKDTSTNESEEKTMKKTMKIEGMMCPHCEAAVKGALEALDGVTSADVSHEAGTAAVWMSAEVADAVLREAVEAKDYKVTGIE